MAITDQSVFSANKLSWQVDGHCILSDLEFSVQPGEFVGLIGPNGAGKSSLLRCLYRKISDFSGQLDFLGQPIASYKALAFARQCAVVLQEPPTDFPFSVRDVIAMGLIPHKGLLDFARAEDRTAIITAARQVDLLDKLDQSYHSLSGGEKQRAMIARAIVQKPQVLIMDEPTNHLDVKHRLEVLQLARSLKITVIVSIHDLNLAAAFCDRFILLNKGRIVASGDHQQVLNQDCLRQVFQVPVHIDEHPFHQKPRITFDTRTSALFSEAESGESHHG